MLSSLISMMRRNIYLHLLFSLLLGTIVGILTIFGQGNLPGNFNSLANLGTVWLVPAFFISSIGERKSYSILSCALCLIGEVMGYFYFHAWMNQYDFTLNYFVLVWLACVIVGGVIFGIAGYLWHHRNEKFHELGSALLAGVFITDGVNMLIHLESYRHMIPVPVAQVVFGLLLIVLLERTMQERRRSLTFLVPIIGLGLIGYAVLFYFTSAGMVIE